MHFPTDTTEMASNTERYIWAVWLILVLITSLIGDTTILITSIKYNAFRLHTLMVAFIQHIALCDLLLAVFTVLPRLISLLCNSWVFGEPLCYVSAYLRAQCFVTSSILIAAMTSGKLWLLKCPLQAKSLTKPRAHLVCGSVWMVASIVPVLYLVIDKEDVRWDYETYYCYYTHSADNTWEILLPWKHGIFGGIPIIVVIITTVVLVKHLLNARKVSKRSRGKVRWQGIVTAVAVATVFTVAVLPTTVYWITQSYLAGKPQQIYFYRTASTVFYFNIASNFFVYFCTVGSFRKFLMTTVLPLYSLHNGKRTEEDDVLSTTRPPHSNKNNDT
ncbi:hypothetical protein ACHWQZ_G002417 [Mnemiopsis leidyi]